MSQSADNNMIAAGANSSGAVADASAGYLSHSASASLNSVPSGMVCPPGYKQTEVGVIPEDWDVCELKDAVSFLDGLRRPVKSGDRAKISGIYPYYGASGIVDYVNDYIFDDELILLGEDGENILSRNLPLAFKVSGKIWVNNHAHVMKPNDYFDITFLTEFLESLDYSLLNSGTAQPKLNKQACLKIKVAKPAKTEQTAIANALSDVDALISELEKLIAKKQAIKTATMQQLLTGRTRLPQFALSEDGTKKGTKPSELGEIPEDWECKPLGELCSLKSGLGITSADIDDSSDYRCFGGNGLRGYTTQFTHEGEYALIGRQGALCGNIQYVSGKFFASEHALVATPRDGIDSRWLAIYLERMNLNQYSESSAQPGLSAEKLRLLAIITPTNKEQTAIATILSDMDAELQALEQRLGKTRQIKQGMMQELLTGKTRLIKPSKEVIHE